MKLLVAILVESSNTTQIYYFCTGYQNDIRSLGPYVHYKSISLFLFWDFPSKCLCGIYRFSDGAANLFWRYAACKSAFDKDWLSATDSIKIPIALFIYYCLVRSASLFVFRFCIVHVLNLAQTLVRPFWCSKSSLALSACTGAVFCRALISIQKIAIYVYINIHGHVNMCMQKYVFYCRHPTP